MDPRQQQAGGTGKPKALAVPEQFPSSSPVVEGQWANTDTNNFETGRTAK
jgi:hypothetical protein